MSKVRVAIPGTVGKSVLIDTGLEPRITALEEAFAAFDSGGNSSRQHKNLLGLQVGNDHPQYPLSRARETIRGQWDFTQQIWAESGDAAAPGWSFTDAADTGAFYEFVSGDTYFSYVVALLHMDGADGGSVFTDSSSYGRTISLTGTPTTVTAVKKYGTASLRLPADSTSMLSFADSAEVRIATGDFTMECWAYRVNTSSNIDIHKNAFTTLFPCRITIIGSGAIGVSGNTSVGAGAYSLTGLATFPTAQWVHIAVTRTGSTFRLFQDGVLQASATYSGTLGENAAAWRIGPASSAVGNVDDFRFTVGISRYTADFTPPTAAFPDSGDGEYMSITVNGGEKFRFRSTGALGIAGASYGNSGDYFKSQGGSASPAWTSPAALTRTSDTNVTLTLGGSPTTALLNAASLTLGWTGTLAPTRGGTGIGTYTAGDLLYASATNVLSNRAIGVTNDVLAVVGGVPTWSQAITPVWTGNHTWNDNLEVRLGTGGDLRLSHDGTNSVIRNDTGVLQFNMAGTARFSVTQDGRFFGGALHNNAGAMTGATNQYIGSGTYTPTLTNVTNVAASTARQCQWLRVGNVVAVSGQVDVDPTTTLLATELGISLPIASAFSTDFQCGGAAHAPAIATQGAAIDADATNDRARMRWVAADVTNQPMTFIFSYEVL